MVQSHYNQDLPSIDAQLNYTLPPSDGSEKLFVHINPEILAPGEKRENTSQQSHKTPIYDIRGAEQRFSLASSGFEVVRTPETVAKLDDGKDSKTSWTDEGWVKDVYEAEVERLLINHLGASRISIFDHTIRRYDHSGTVKDTPQTRQPVLRVHIDQTPASALARVKRHLGADADELLKKRFALINVWRPLRGPVLDAPLALADYRTVDKDKDVVPLELRRGGGEPSGETFVVLHNPRHHWYYLSKMDPEEALLIKCFDSDDRLASFTPHTAFYDDRYRGNVPERESIEVRALVFF